jgi:hypothetical protein
MLPRGSVASLPGGCVGIQYLDGDVAIEDLVKGLVDGARSAASEPVHNSVMADGAANHSRRVPRQARQDKYPLSDVSAEARVGASDLRRRHPDRAPV